MTVNELMKKFNEAERKAAACERAGDMVAMQSWEKEAVKWLTRAEKKQWKIDNR